MALVNCFKRYILTGETPIPITKKNDNNKDLLFTETLKTLTQITGVQTTPEKAESAYFRRFHNHNLKFHWLAQHQIVFTSDLSYANFKSIEAEHDFDRCDWNFGSSVLRVQYNLKEGEISIKILKFILQKTRYPNVLVRKHDTQ